MADDRHSETNYSPQFAIANPAPGAAPAGKKPSSTAKAGGVATGAPGHVPPSAMIAAYYPPAGYNNGSSRAICGFDASTSDHFSCASNLTSSGLGHYPAVAGGVGKKDVAVGAAVVGLVVAIVLVL